MALELPTVTGYGVMGEYWKITRIEFDSLEGRDFLVVNLWVDSSSCCDGKRPLIERAYYFPSEITPFTEEALSALNSTPRSVGYAWLLTQPEFEGASEEPE